MTTYEETGKQMSETVNAKNTEFAPETLNLFDEVEMAIKEIDTHRPFQPEVGKQISDEFLPDRVTASLNMEGISVTRRQTLLMMDAMRLTENHTKTEQELLNALEADELVFDLATQGHPLSVSVIREINQTLQKEVLHNAGSFREKDVEITGASFQPPSHFEVSELITKMLSDFERLEAQHPMYKASWLHATFTHIHPFEDGNGRTGRLLQDFVLLSYGYFPTGIPSSLRDNYYEALERADAGDWNSLCQMICDLQLRTLSRVKAIIESVQERSDFVSILVSRASQKKTGGLHKQYTVWRQRMQNFSDELVSTCDEIDRSSDVIGVRSERFDVIDFQKWQELISTGKSTNTWFLKQTWYSEGNPFYRTILFFSRHFFRPCDPFPEEEMKGRVGLQITGGPPEYGARFDFQTYSDGEIRFRELLFVGDDTLHYFGTGHEVILSKRLQEEWNCEQIERAGDLVSKIIEDIFVRKLGI